MNKILSNLLKGVLRLVAAGLLFLLLIFGINPITAKADELYFDEEGNLYFHTSDKAASGSVRYKTIGWVIKRYDMPMDAPEQQYVIVTKSQYKPDEPAPDKEGYVLCYFYTDKNEILDAVSSVSEEWYNILTGYGDDVYIDSVMTVVEGGKELGTLYSGGKYSGEVYFTYEGIAGARGWASPESLMDDYNNKVAFPQIVEKRERSIEVVTREEISFTNSRYSAFIMGSGVYGSEEFSLSAGIPSGSSLYVRGRADTMRAKLKLTKVTVKMTECIEIPVTYLLRWQDYYGNYQHDTRVIYRYYDVDRYFTYYEFSGLEQYRLSKLRITGSILENGGVAYDSVDVGDAISCVYSSYGAPEAHIVDYYVNETNSIGTVLLVGENGKKPTIPDADYSELAESFLGDVYVRNDRVTVNGVTVLSDETRLKNGTAPQVALPTVETNIYHENIMIDAQASNGMCKDCAVELIYINDSGEELTGEIALSAVNVHTPVYCDVSIYADKTLNQAVSPTVSDVVLGEYVTVVFNDFGMHRDIKGYGLRSYSRYVGGRQLCCPFAVEYNGEIYEADTWLDVEDYSVTLRILEYNEEGNYVIYARTQAYNGITDIADRAIEENANLSVDSYGAWDAVEVRVIGKLCNLELEYMGNSYEASQMPVEVLVNTEEDGVIKDEEAGQNGDARECRLSFVTVGDMTEEDTVEIKYSYYYEDKNGMLIPVEIYGVEGRNYLDGVITGGFDDSKILTFHEDGCWSTDFLLYDELLVVPQGTSTEDIQAAIRENRMQDICFSAGSVIVCVDIVSYKDGAPYLSYINEENAKRGYCNRWLIEGGTESYPYGAVLKIELGEHGYYDYEVSGTH